ncbi:TIGR01777 family oxidoreductase [Ammoniphilus sp. YIM 78166]|uniref:TIGR01777 family oxidoreductase n=1 Tax=Ammoniphilus sp. YIM 78166 TaxID=1644106 RepID=UPI00106F0AF2|nr:TIGR01777 family oxidoreductase [Ammoniphilus sp. YIM 78166]
MKIAVLGGTGFIGGQLARQYIQQGHSLFLFTRNPHKYNTGNPLITYLKWPLQGGDTPLAVDALINLAGESINQRWTSSAKASILNSRIETTRELAQELEKGIRTSVLLNASAVGYYGHSTTEIFDEDAMIPPQDFLAEVVHAWEEEVKPMAQQGIRVIRARFGVVLGREGGALPKMVLPYKLFAGGRVGSGNQYLSWIHIDDVVGLMLHCIEKDGVQAAVNFTAPNPVTMDQFGKTVGQVLHRPHWLPTPAFVLQLALGEMSDLVLKGQQVIPHRALETGYRFKYPFLKEALEDCL